MLCMQNSWIDYLFKKSCIEGVLNLKRMAVFAFKIRYIWLVNSTEKMVDLYRRIAACQIFSRRFGTYVVTNYRDKIFRDLENTRILKGCNPILRRMIAIEMCG